MAFSFSMILGVIRFVSKIPAIQEAGIALLSGLADKLISKADDPDAVRKIATEIAQGAPAIVGAIVKNTPAEKQVDKALIHDPGNRATVDVPADPKAAGAAAAKQ